MKKFLLITGIIFIVLIALAILIPIVFKKQIQTLVKKEINKSLNAKIVFSDVKLSLFRHFPKVAIVIDDLSITGLNEFSTDTLLKAKKSETTAGLFNVLKGEDIKLYGLYFDSAQIHALVNKDGKANWDIVKEVNTSAAGADTSVFKLTLNKYQISNGYLVYKDEVSNTFTELINFDHVGSGNLTADVYTLSTITKASSVTIIQDEIPYLSGTKTTVETDIVIDNNTDTYTFHTKDILLNDLKLSARGFFQLLNDSSYKMDITFESASNDFKEILSMIPVMYKKDFSEIKTSGKAIFNGFVKGTYTPQQMPAYNVNLEVKDASFQYPDLPKPVKNIQLTLKASNVDGLPDNSVLDISKGHLEMDNEPFDFRLLYKNPVTTQLIDASVKGKLDLSQLSQMIKLDKETKLSGQVWADAFVRGPLKAIQNQSGNFIAGGFFEIKNLLYAAADFPQPINNGNIKATLENNGGVADNTTINISSGHIEIGNDPVDFTLQLRKPFSALDFSGHAKGSFTLDHIKQFATLEPGTSIAGKLNADMGFSGNKSAITKKEYDKIILDGYSSVKNLKYISKDYPSGISIKEAALLFNPKNVIISNLDGQYLNTGFSSNGSLNNLIGFFMENQELTGSLNVQADKINLNDWLGISDDTATADAAKASQVFLVPENVRFSINAKVDQVKYEKVDYNDINGNIVIDNEEIVLKKVTANVLDGNVAINGTYSTRLHKQEPDIRFSYDIKDMDIQKAFLSYNTVQVLMPIGKFLSGKLNSQLTMTGNLLGSMMPKMSSLSGNGNMLLLQGVLKKFAPLEKLAAALGIDQLKSITVKDIKNYIEFANGKVMVKPFALKIDEIEMEIGGFHGFDNSIDYAIQMKLPRKLMGAQGNNLINNLAADAVKKGIPLNLSEIISLHIKMTGSITDPVIGINLKEIAGDAIKQLEDQAKDFIQAKIDSSKQKVKDSIQAVKEQVMEKTKDKLLDQLFGKDSTGQNKPQDSTKKIPESGIKKTIKDILNRPKQPVKDTL